MIEDRAICTIIAKNYVAFARTLAQSLRAFHPDYQFYVLIVDDFEDYINPADEPFEIVKLTDLAIPNLPGFCFKYDIKELCTATKAHLLDYLISEKSVARLIYLDPDILVTGSLDGLFEKLGSHDIVLTPHLDTDYPNDGLLPDDGYILRAGQFNLGFIGVNASDNAQSFLKWWQPKLYQKCVVDLMHGYFVDQKFVDFVPILFGNIFVERDTGYNVAYWNLHSRLLNRKDGTWSCNGGRLYFFHFSGYKPEGDEISSHIPGSVARHRLSHQPELRELFAAYKNLLMQNGFEQTSIWPYTFGCFKTGERIPDSLRSHYRNHPGEWRTLGDPFSSEKLKRQAGIDTKSVELDALTPAEQLNTILNSRAWRWVCRYGRFKSRYLTPPYQRFTRVFGSQAQQSEKRRPGNQESDEKGFGGTTESPNTSNQPATICFCTLAIHAPYRLRARVLCSDATMMPWIVLTDEPDDFKDLPVRAIRHAPTGPMAVDYLASLPATGEGRGAAAYHDKRFALRAALEDFDTAIYLDADSRIAALPPPGVFPAGLAVLPVVRKSVAEHLETCGSWRLPIFEDLARHLTGSVEILQAARWCHETVIAVTRDGREDRFFEAWSVAADFLQTRAVYSGEGGVIGLAAACAGWGVDYAALTNLAAAIQHEGGGPKQESD